MFLISAKNTHVVFFLMKHEHLYIFGCNQICIVKLIFIFFFEYLELYISQSLLVFIRLENI